MTAPADMDGYLPKPPQESSNRLPPITGILGGLV
jgi:hypothetical protein